MFGLPGADVPYCYLTTVGRRSGRPHTIEIWFGAEGRTLYLLAGGGDRADWVRNLEVTPEVEVTLAGRRYAAVARLLEPPPKKTASPAGCCWRSTRCRAPTTSTAGERRRSPWPSICQGTSRRTTTWPPIPAISKRSLTTSKPAPV